MQMSRTQKNKATEYHLGQLKAKLAKLRTQLQEPAKVSYWLMMAWLELQCSSCAVLAFWIYNYILTYEKKCEYIKAKQEKNLLLCRVLQEEGKGLK